MKQVRASERGFTLIEIMIVIAILAMVTAMVAPRLTSPNTKIRNAVRTLAALTKNLQTHARLRQMTYRLAIQMDPKEGYTYWVESSPGAATVMTEKQEKLLQDMTSFDKKKQHESATFTKDKEFVRKAIALPRSLKFLEVEYKGREKSINEGMAYIHFFPFGLSPEAAIHIGDGKKLHWTLAIRPLTGQADIFPEDVRLKDITQ